VRGAAALLSEILIFYEKLYQEKSFPCLKTKLTFFFAFIKIPSDIAAQYKNQREHAVQDLQS
jgi:hypothetical protein